MFGVVEIEEDEGAQSQRRNQGEIQIERPDGNGEHLGIFRELGKFGAGRLRIQKEIPWSFGFSKELQEVQGHIVQHQGEEGFVGAESNLQCCYEQTVYTAAQCAAQGHHQYYHRSGQRFAQLHGGSARPEGPHNKLSLAADVPKAHFEGQSQSQRDDQ